MRRFRGPGVTLVLALLAMVFSAVAAFSAEAEFKAHYATQLSKTFHLTEADYKFAELVAQKTDGRLKIDVFPAGQLYKGAGHRQGHLRRLPADGHCLQRGLGRTDSLYRHIRCPIRF